LHSGQYTACPLPKLGLDNLLACAVSFPAKIEQRSKAMAETESIRARAVEMAVSQIEKVFGKGAIMRLGEGTAATSISVISTGSIALDMALGVGGVPRGRITEIFGPESSGKTTLAQHIIAEAQRG